MATHKLSPIGTRIRDRALSYPESTESFPWGEHAFKVNGKTFVFLRDDEGGLSFSVKLFDLRDEALSLPGSEPTHYGLGAKGWVTLKPASKSKLPQLERFVEESYRLNAPKRALKLLDGDGAK